MRNNKLVISATGHRPKYFPCKYDETHEWYLNLVKDVEFRLTQLKPSAIISGMAIGFDMLFAEAGLNLGIPVHAYIPYKAQGENWPAKTYKRYLDILNTSDAVFICSKEYHKHCFFKRDELMIDHSSVVFSLLNPLAKSGGTFYTKQYAIKQEKEIIEFWRD